MVKPWQSKTHWTALVLAVLAFIPGMDELIAQHPTVTVIVQSLIMVGLRWITKSPVSLP